MKTAEKPKCLSCGRDLSFVEKHNFWVCHICMPPFTEAEIFGDMTLSERKLAGKNLRENHGMTRKWSW